MTSLILAALLQGDLREVTFEFAAPAGAERVSVAGSFNNWNKDAAVMERGPDGRTWRLTMTLPAGRYEYKFVVNGETWVVDPKGASVDDGNGNVNTLLLIFPVGYEAEAAKGDGTITVAALKHKTQMPYLNYDRGQLTLTLRARPGDVDSVVADLGNGRTVRMEPRGGDEIYTYYTGRMAWDRRTAVRYQFRVTDGGTVMTFGADGDRMFEIQPESFAPFTVPRWVEGTVFYQIFPDRFGNGSAANDPSDVMAWDAEPTYWGFMGGDLAGIDAGLPYLKGLGVGAVYLNPVFAGPSNHRYETTNYFEIDPRLGTNEEFAQLTRRMEGMGIRTILDGVFNHTSTDFAAFADVRTAGENSKFRDWYTVRSWPVRVGENPNYEAWFGYPSMPKVNLLNPEAAEFMLDVPRFWARNATVHGWRLDVANEVPMEFWRQFRDVVKGELGEDEWIVGEHWGDSSPWLKGDQWDSCMNYQFREAVLRFVVTGRSTPSQFWANLIRVYDAYGPQVSRNMLNLISSHDTPRILTLSEGDEARALLAAKLMFTWIGAPCIYYGDELGMEGGRDPDNRRGMEWDRVGRENRFLTTYGRLAALRNGSEVLQAGDPVFVTADDATGVLVFARELRGERVYVVVNRSRVARNVTFTASGGRWIDFLTERHFEVRSGQLTATVGAMDVTVLGASTTSSRALAARLANWASAPRPTALSGGLSSSRSIK